uniref:Uncharacterized protein n=1 Tax=Mycena chlorophos TaxID=658473 RepID=A0ABQ0LEU9_MYCCL|nr:predicted protein [Mycena chlorophos]
MPVEGFKIHNNSNEIILCSVTLNTKTTPALEIKPFESRDYVPRTGWEDLVVTNKAKDRQMSLWVNRGALSLIHFDGFDKSFRIYNDYRPEPGFVLMNLSSRTIVCFVSNNTNRSQQSLTVTIKPGTSSTFVRSGWEAIGIWSEDEKQRKGVFIDNKKTLIKVDFLGFDEEMVVHDAPEDFILSEHVAEANRISDRSYAQGNSRASLPGGLNASIEKMDKLELACTGKKWSLADHNQIYTLALLINHLNYGLAEPALVVSVTPEWVKVAAFSDEFDSIVVLGFPAKVIDQVAPERTRPTVGSRLLVVNQFDYKTAQQPEPVADITPGPNARPNWTNMHPLVAQYVCDDSLAPKWEERMSHFDDEKWREIWEHWVLYKEKHGENYFRLGAPSRIKAVATNHVDGGLPAYVP